MPYTCLQRKPARERSKAAPEQTPDVGRDLSLPRSGPLSSSDLGGEASPRLDAVMRERMARTFGDLSAIRDYRPSEPAETPAVAGPCTGPVTHALSGASPSPFSAGVMQARLKTDQEVWKEDEALHETDMDTALAMPEDDPDKPELRPWEITPEMLAKNHFNPTGSRSLAIDQAQVDSQSSPDQAYNLFSNVSVGYGHGHMYKRKGKEWVPWDPKEIDPKMFKAKLKNMQRMIHDYPELSGMIGDMYQRTDFATSMATDSTVGGRRKAHLEYNAS